jgi:hypothetical protein
VTSGAFPRLLLGVGSALLPGGVARAAEPARASSRADEFLSWHAPPGCGDGAAIRERVSDLLGQRELDLERVRRVEGRVHAARDGWALTLRLFDAFGVRERELSSRYCDDLAEAAAVAITLAFEAAGGVAAPVSVPTANDSPANDSSGSGAASSREAPGSTSLVLPEPSAAAAASSHENGDERQPRATRFALGAEVLVDGSALSGAAVGASIGAWLRWTELRLGAYAIWLPAAEQSVGPSQRIEFSLVAAGVRACYALGHGLVDTALCTGFEAGQLSARGVGLADARSSHDLWLAPQLGLELSAEPWQRFTLQAHAEAVAPLLRQGYAVNETEEVHHVSGLGARAGLGFLVGF